MSLQTVTMQELRDLIDYQLSAIRKAEKELSELRDLMTESCGELLRRVDEAESEAGKPSKRKGENDNQRAIDRWELDTAASDRRDIRRRIAADTTQESVR